MPRVQLSFTQGQLRQPGLWGKVLQPNGSIYEYSMEKDVEFDVQKTTRTFTFPTMAEGVMLLFGVKGFHSAGTLANVFLLLRVEQNQSFDWQMPGALARFEGKFLRLVAQSETDLQPIYAALTQLKYGSLARLQEMLRKENVDRPPTAPPK